jgi:membrane associated rhomboid family serine protease
MYSFYPITIGILILTSIISVAAFSNSKIMNTLIFWPPAVHMKHQYYRFATCGLIHANVAHLAFNMFSFYFFGRAVEVYYMGILGLEHYNYFILYAGAVIVANIPTYFKHRDDYNYRSLGASGGVCAVIFAYILMRPWDTIYIIFFPAPAIAYAVLFLAYSVYMSKKGGDNVNHDAHFWGAAFGMLFTIAVRPGVLRLFLDQLGHPHFNF